MATGQRAETVPGVARGLALLFATAQFIVVLDACSVSIALPKIAESLGIGPSQLQWVVTSYSVAFGGLLLAGGRIADVRGRRETFIAGAWLFLAGSLGAALASSFAMLLAARVTQGAAAAALAPAGYALLTDTFREPRERIWALGLLGSMLGAGFTVGTLAGGVLTATFGWRAVFLANVPVAATIGIAAHMLLARERRRYQRRTGVVGAGAMTVGFGALLFTIAQFDTTAPRGSLVLGGLVALAGMLVFTVAQRRSDDPLIPPSLAGIPAVWRANATIVLGSAADAGVFIFLAIYLQQRRGLSPMQTTAILIVPGVATIGAGRLAGALVAAHGARRTLMLSLALQAAAIATMAERAPPLPLVVVATTIAAASCVVAGVCAATLATTPARLADGGLAGSLVNASDQLGTALGVAVVASLLGAGQLARPLVPADGGSGVWPIMLAGAALAASGAWIAQGLSTGAPTATGAVSAGRSRD